VKGKSDLAAPPEMNARYHAAPKGVYEVFTLWEAQAKTGLAGAKDQLRIQSRFNERVNEVFFASCVILTEGDPDEIATRCALEYQGMELDKRSISVIPVGGIREIPIIAQLLMGLNIPTLAVIDEDPGNPNTAAARLAIEVVTSAQNVFIQSPNLETLFGLANKPRKIDAMAIFPTWFNNAANATPAV
jgi:hypothetical protein